MNTDRRSIPAVEKVLQSLGPTALPRPFVVALVRRELAAFRAGGRVPPLAGIIRQIRRGIEGLECSRLQPVINGTGIIIHTNFGRAPLGSDAIRAITEIGSAYNNLEYDLATGNTRQTRRLSRKRARSPLWERSRDGGEQLRGGPRFDRPPFYQEKTGSDHFPRRTGPDRRRIPDRRNSGSERRAPAGSWRDKQDCASAIMRKR